MAVKDYSATAGLNLLISGINIAEGCAPSGLNDAFRQLMADLAAVLPGFAKAWAYVTVSGGTPTLAANFNVTSVTDNAAGDFTFNFTTAFASGNYAYSGTARRAGTSANEAAVVNQHPTVAPAAASCRVQIARAVDNSLIDEDFCVFFFGTQ